ncbi:hypothetical protein CEXT_62851 [Caerostris extrusa]|uniref:Uncharacterized protein n=1 Tax=Caerostris extrusa TaxID=172846 RepID=A0AAV4XPK4_CAEEX|nr:hypothetical protein CEXT_62851 [Caerostris extrusa]
MLGGKLHRTISITFSLETGMRQGVKTRKILIAEGREGGVNSKSFRTSERRDASNLVTRDEPLLAVIDFVPPQVPKRELMNTIHPSFSANYNLIRRSVEGLFFAERSPDGTAAISLRGGTDFSCRDLF